MNVLGNVYIWYLDLVKFNKNEFVSLKGYNFNEHSFMGHIRIN